MINHMVEQQSHHLDAVFHALADPTRRAMVQNLAKGPSTVTELATPFAMSLAAASKHIKVLERAGLIDRTVRGRTHVCRLNAGPIQSGLEWMKRYEKFWSDRLDILEARLLAEDRLKAESSKSRRKK